MGGASSRVAMITPLARVLENLRSLKTQPLSQLHSPPRTQLHSQRTSQSLSIQQRCQVCPPPRTQLYSPQDDPQETQRIIQRLRPPTPQQTSPLPNRPVHPRRLPVSTQHSSQRMDQPTTLPLLQRIHLREAIHLHTA